MAAIKKNLGAFAVQFAREVLNVDSSIVTNNHKTSVRDLEQVLEGWPRQEGVGYRRQWRNRTGRAVVYKPATE